MKNPLEHYPRRILRGVDHAFTDDRENLPGTLESMYEVVKSGSNTSRRVYSLFSILRKALPEDLWKKFGLPETLRDYSHFPFDLKKYELKYRIGSGAQCDCFLVEPLDKEDCNAFALKVFQNTGSSLAEVEQKAKRVNEDYATLSGWYKVIEGLIPEQTSVISESFQLPHGRPVFMVLQNFLGSDVRDLALDVSEAEWKDLCVKNPQLKTQLKDFIFITREKMKKYNKVPDILGYDNLALVDSANSPHLVFLDSSQIKSFNGASKEGHKVESRLALLEKMAGIS